MSFNDPTLALRRYFAGLAEAIFETELGVADPPLVDYLSGLLFRFVRYDSLNRRRDLASRPIQEVSRLATEAAARVGPARRDMHRQIGDVTLFWTGLFPEALRRPSSDTAGDPYTSFCQQGKRAYLIASRIETVESPSDEDVQNEVLERLSCQFEMCAYGLREVRRQWERSDNEGQPPLLLG